MVKKIKIFFKKNILGIIIGGLIFGTAGVYAATYFPSYNVTYDNTESGLSSTDVQGAIDELYNECFPPIIIGGKGILEVVDIVNTGDGLYKDEYEDGRYFFKGKNPNNYIKFNDEKKPWRIISIENDGTIKILKEESIGNITWDGNKRGSWQEATLNTYLNNDYYNNLTVTAQSQIVNHNFSIGGVDYDNDDIKGQITTENSKVWNGKIGLITASEFIRTSNNKTSCGTNRAYNDNADLCKSTNWMHSDYHFWTISLYKNSTTSGINIFSEEYYGMIIGIADIRYETPYVRPALYLSSSIKITGGDGSENNPFVIE